MVDLTSSNFPTGQDVTALISHCMNQSLYTIHACNKEIQRLGCNISCPITLVDLMWHRHILTRCCQSLVGNNM